MNENLNKTCYIDYREHRNNLGDLLPGKQNDKVYSRMITRISFIVYGKDLIKISKRKKKYNSLTYDVVTCKNTSSYPVLNILERFGVNKEKVIIIIAHLENKDLEIYRLLREVVKYKNSIVLLHTIGYLPDRQVNWLHKKMIESKSFIIPIADGDVFDDLDWLDGNQTCWDLGKLIVGKLSDLSYSIY